MSRRAMTVCLGACLTLLPIRASAQGSASATAVAAAKSYGFTNDELDKILHGEVLDKDLKEDSDKELAGVVAIWLPNPLVEFADFTLEGKPLKLDASVRSLHVWKKDEAADKAFADLPLESAQQSMLRGRYEAYRKAGLKDAGPAGPLITLAIKETKSLERRPGFAEALIDFPADPLPGMEHRFFAYVQDTEGKPTVILSHRAAVRGEHDALITEQRYYVSQTYEGRFIASDCYEEQGGTLVFYVNMLFTDQVSGFGSTIKHSVGRRRMLATVATQLKRMRDQLER